jgi:hypothetical protein
VVAAAAQVMESQPVQVAPLLVVLEVLTLETAQMLQLQIRAVVVVEAVVLLVPQFPVVMEVLALSYYAYQVPTQPHSRVV